MGIEEFVKLFGPEDLGLMTGIGVVAVFLHRSEVITLRWALLLPVLIGTILGMLQAWAANPGLFGTGLYFTKGIILGGGSGLVGRGVSVALDKTGLFPVPPAKPNGPPAKGNGP